MTLGIIPAAGKAERLNGLPKALLPIPGGATLIETVYERMKRASLCWHIAIGTNRTTYAFLRQREAISESVYKAETRTMSETVLTALPYLNGNEPVLFGMADTYFEDADAFVKLATALKDGADVAVGVFKARPEQRAHLGMVEIAGDEVLHVIDKPQQTGLIWAWGVLAWKVGFWAYLNTRDPHVGYALPRALAAELDVRAVRMDGQYWDCGTPDEYFECVTALRDNMTTSQEQT